MYLSKLQKYILLESYLSKKKKCSKKEFLKYYQGSKKKIKEKDQQSIITKSVERLIAKELMIGYGEKTPHRLYIKEIKLTPLGRRIAKKILDTQSKLPFRYLKKHKIAKC